MTSQQGETLAYNGDGVLVQAGTTFYTQDLVAPLAQVLSDGSNTYLYGLDRLATVDSSGTRTWALHDELGSVRQTLDDTGAALTASGLSFSPFGVPQSGAQPAPFGFTGELHHDDLVYLRARWYDAGSGTFTSHDPFEGFPTRPYSLHPYQYGYSDPVQWTDPSGLCATGAVIDTAACATAGAAASLVAIPVVLVGAFYYYNHDAREDLMRGVDYVIPGGQEYVWTGGTVAPREPPRELPPPVDPPNLNDIDTDALNEALEQAGDVVDGLVCTNTGTQDDEDSEVWYHYTDSSGAMSISNSGVIHPDGKNRVFVTQRRVRAEDALNELFAGNPAYIGKGSHVAEFRIREGTILVPGTQPDEFIHYGSLRNGRHIDIIRIVPNNF
jgi:RHS repeat-associated protein